jgi:hypothetical protein
MFMDTEGQFTGDRGRTNLYINLLKHWTEIAAMQKAEPAKSRRDLQQWLIAEAKIPISMNDIKRIVINTSGGDAPGLNAVIHAVVHAAHTHD